MSFVSPFSFFSNQSQTMINDAVMIGDNLSTFAFDSLYGWLLSKLHQLHPENTTEQMINKFPHPMMCVIGCESTGKSATIENITKVSIFPTSSGICTRCPIKVCMIPSDKFLSKTAKDTTSSSSSSVYTLSYKNDAVLTFDDNNVSDMKSAIAAIFERIRSSSTGMGYDKNEITIVMHRPNIIRMDFVDLPGIVSYPPEARDFTLEISNEYIRNPNSFILCVANATVPRLTSYEPIARIIQERACQRTILVLPMADKLPSHDISTHLIDRVLLLSDELRQHSFCGCCSVVNRSEASHIRLEDQSTIEATFFQSTIFTPILEQIKLCPQGKERVEMRKNLNILKQRLGVEHLIHHANKQYEKYITDNWIPRTLEDISKEIEVINRDINALGDVVTSENLPMFQDMYKTHVVKLFFTEWDAEKWENLLFTFDFKLSTATADYFWGLIEEHVVTLMTKNISVNEEMFSPPYCIQRFDQLNNYFLTNLRKVLLENVQPVFYQVFDGNILPILLEYQYDTRNGTHDTRASSSFFYIMDQMIEEFTRMETKPPLEVFEEDETMKHARQRLKEKMDTYQTIQTELRGKMATPVAAAAAEAAEAVEAAEEAVEEVSSTNKNDEKPKIRVYEPILY